MGSFYICFTDPKRVDDIDDMDCAAVNTVQETKAWDYYIEVKTPLAKKRPIGKLVGTITIKDE